MIGEVQIWVHIGTSNKTSFVSVTKLQYHFLRCVSYASLVIRVITALRATSVANVDQLANQSEQEVLKVFDQLGVGTGNRKIADMRER